MKMTTNRNSYIIEFIAQGRYVKVTAIDPQTGLEVSIVGDVRENKEILKKHAVNKLERRLAKPEGSA